MSKFGVTAQSTTSGFRRFQIKGGQKYKPAEYKVEGDYSQAAFWLAAGAMDGGICCEGLQKESLQGDKEMLRIIEALGYSVTWEDGSLKACAAAGERKKPTNRERKTMVDCSQIPDIVPIAATLAALTPGVTIFSNAARLRLKESDRLDSITVGLKNLGADIKETHDSIIVRGIAELKGGTVDACNDHRIAMALAIAAVKCKGKVTILGHDCVDKSYPDFWFDYMNLGGILNERDLGK
jgi:3-phosphoshikimate 1-carboxyvinyltransferase